MDATIAERIRCDESLRQGIKQGVKTQGAA